MRCAGVRLGDLNPRGVGVSEVVLYIAASLDGFIADNDGGVDWLAEDRFKDGGLRMKTTAMRNFTMALSW